MKFESDKRLLSQDPQIKKPRPKIVPPPPTFKPSNQSAHFVLVKLQPGSLVKALKAIKRLKGISGFHPVYGEWDLVLIIRERKGVNKSELIKRLWDISSVLEVSTLVAAS
jgi:hypothetical protein